MHHEFQRFLKPNKLGIDYSKLTNFNTMSVISSHLKKQQPFWEKKIQEAIENNNKVGLIEALSTAEAIGLAAAKPDLMRKARAILQSMI